MSRRYAAHTVNEVFAFWGMVIAGFSHLLGGITRTITKWATLNNATIMSIFDYTYKVTTTLGNIALFLAIVLSAWQFVKYKTKGWRIFYWIAFGVFVLGVVFGVVLTWA